MVKLTLERGQLLTLVVVVLLQATSIAADSVYVYGEPKFKCPAKPKLIYPCICQKGSDIGLYIRCENVNLATLSVALQNLAALGVPVEDLTLYKGHFAHLYGPLFANVNVRVLHIIDCPIVAIEDYAFYGINKTLEELHILRSNLSSITPLAFGMLGKVGELVLDGHSLDTLQKDLFLEQEISNHLEIVRIVNGALRDLPIETFQPLRKLKTLDLHGNQLVELKRQQFKNLRSVEVLDVSYNNIKKLEAQHIADLTKLGWCNISHNALAEIPRGTFSRNSVLKWLSMTHNNIARLDMNSFRGMRFLRRLYLSDNRIDTIGRGTFGSIAKIGTIDLARNALKKIEFQMFSQLNYVEELNMAENNITLVEKNAFKDIYSAVINISHNALERIESLAFENCVNITVLDLSHNRLVNFSRNAFDLNTFANDFQVSHNFLTDMAQVPLQNMTGIRIVNASFNRITQIPKNCFPKLYELHTIDVAHNNITAISNGVFQTLFSLRFLNLSHNSLQEIKSSVFGSLPTLLELDLSHNELASVSRGALTKLSSVRSLNLQHNRLERLFQIPISLNELHVANNRLTAIPAGTWPVMNALLLLDMSHNQIGDALDGGSFTGLLVLQRLLLTANGVTQPPLAGLAGMNTLQYLHLEHNNISALGKSAFGKLPVLFELHLHANVVKDVSARAFEGLLQLLTLNLSSNDIQTLPTDAFIGLPSLRKLDLSDNSITKMDNKTNGVLDSLLSLEELNLSRNKISFVTKKTFPSNQWIPYNLRYLDLSYNQMPVLTYDLTFGTSKLQRLNLSHNHINELRKGVLANMTALRTLDLSYNDLSNLAAEEHIFDLPRNLSELLLQHNRIYRLPFEQFNRSQPFDLIDLRANNLTEFPLTLVWNLRNGTAVRFIGNPLHCNCAARSLKHYTMELTDLPEDLSEVRCAAPPQVADERLEVVEDEQLVCTTKDDRRQYTGMAYDELSDVRFRDVTKARDNSGNMTVRWFVTSTRDIADFTLVVRNADNEILHQSEHAYNVRSAQIHLADLSNDKARLAGGEICLLTRNSAGKTGRWFAAQCTHLPDVAPPRRSFFSPSSGSAGAHFRMSLFALLCGGCLLLISLRV